MRHSVAVRLVILCVALLASLTAPGLAVAHGWAHEHLAHEHAAQASSGHQAHDAHDDDHDEVTAASGDHHADAIVLRPTEHGHEHDHATLDIAPGARDLGRLLPPAVLAQVPAVAPLTAISEVRCAALVDHALLARPDPARGSPPALRAPPAC